MTDTPHEAEKPLEVVEPVQTQPSAHERMSKALADLKSAGDNGANWFFWIAALSLVNTIVAHSGGDRHFIVGLAVTFLVDLIGREIVKDHPESASVVLAIAVGFSLFVDAFVVLFGVISRQRWLWVYGIGMFMYLLDGILYALLGDFLSAGFHVYALLSMFQGFKSYQEYNRLQNALNEDAAAEVEPIVDAEFA